MRALFGSGVMRRIARIKAPRRTRVGGLSSHVSLIDALFASRALCAPRSPARASPIPTRTTNAARLAAGLAPLRPGTLWGSRTRREPTTSASPVPPTPHKKVLAMVDAGGDTVGYVTNTFPGQTSSPIAATEFYHVPGSPGSLRSPSQYASLGMPDPYLGVQGYSGNATTMGTRSPNYAIFVSRYDPAGPADSPPDAQGTETAVFDVDETTGEVSVTWTNPDGSQVPLRALVVYNENTPYDRRIYLTGSIGNFTSVYAQGNTVVPVTVKLIDIVG
ncbi:hypothetical protein EXIGLDRAFT_829349 [Exidia glandulosa HHB12029]|uniref:Uncharacterized protein n=1 Tax=Exidia glandulosa HHB12029 TaxID=1314781 RepID=A0A165PPD7_EXIGL|nr:hypothetical protein EXIGLDRAFT_829349 [Exidia glandulosa HHB12029]